MADIRINALATTAASTASDDFIAVDGSANGTRKLNAYSPTFGGNLTVSGTGTSAFSGAIKARSGGADEVGFGPYGTGTGGIYFGNGTVSLFNDANTQLKSLVGLSLAGNLTVSGTGTSSVAGVFKAGTDIVLGNTSAFQVHNNVDDKPMIGFYRGGTLRSVLRLNTDNDFRLLSSDLSTLANLIVGNLLIGTTTDSANGKLQLATHTTSAGGIGFGTDTSLFRAASGNLGLYGTGTSSKITFSHSTTTAGKGFDVECDSAKDAYVWNRENRNIYFGTNNTTALTLDSSQNATFEKNINAGGASNDADIRLHLTAAGDTSAKFAALWRNSSSTKIFHLRADGDLYTSAGATITGAIAIGNTVQTAAAVASTHKVTISIGGTTYYLLATNV